MVLVIIFMLFYQSVADAQEFIDTLERDYSLRSIGLLQITNYRGGVTLKGWTMDKIRVIAKRKVLAQTEEQAKTQFSAMDFKYRAVSGGIEISAIYGQGLSIEEKLNERKNPALSMELEIRAPSNLNVTIWTVGGSVDIDSWNAPVRVRTFSGKVQAKEIHAAWFSLTCSACSAFLNKLKGSLRCIGGSGDIGLRDVLGQQVFVEVGSGKIVAETVSGMQTYVSKNGKISGKNLEGKVEFQTQNGEVDLRASRGFVSGRTIAGDIHIQMDQWRFVDKALIESDDGDVYLTLPSTFSGEIDLWIDKRFDGRLCR